jgi:hypothetical protein
MMMKRFYHPEDISFKSEKISSFLFFTLLAEESLAPFIKGSKGF